VDGDQALERPFVFDYASGIDFGWEVSYIVRGLSSGVDSLHILQQIYRL